MSDENTRLAGGGCSCGYRAGSWPTRIGCGAAECPFPTETHDVGVVVHDHAIGVPDDGFGQCHCGHAAAVKVNGNPLCIPHMNEEFAGISELTRRIAANIAAQQEEES